MAPIASRDIFESVASPEAMESLVRINAKQGNEDIQMTGVCKFEPLPNVKTILVTGGAGFIGSWMTRHLVQQYQHDYTVVCLDKMDTVSSLNNILALFEYPNFRFVHGSICDGRTVDFVLETYQVDCVMHFAANSHVQNSFGDPFTFTDNNVLGTHVLLDRVRAYGKVQRFIHVSTDEVYGETNRIPAREGSTLLAPTNPYSASKAAAEMYVMAYQRSFRIPAIIVRSNNVYGPCQYPEKLIPRFSNLMLKGHKLTLQGDGTHARRFLYAADAADAFDTILHKGVVGEVYNIDSRYEVQNREVAARIMHLFGRDPAKDFDECVAWIPDRPFNDGDYCVDGSKLQQLGWKQRVDFASGLAMTVEWYKRHLSFWWHSLPGEHSKGWKAQPYELP
ncbi:hypothetical protein Plec18167_005161 [Paecilomyces lecythidis]|uniref:NAD(P)-binding domain-containing protein n=1 Tax=Paecilomyces lecythidis TaxID=3004212 RepID=A0ABR3XLA6_9EURO